MKDLTKYFIDLSKLSGDKLKSLVPILENAGYHVYFEDRIFLKHGKYHKPYFHLLNNKSWMSSLFLVMKTELTYPEFIKLFEGGEGELCVKVEEKFKVIDLPKPYMTPIKSHPTAQVQADKAELLEALEASNCVLANCSFEVKGETSYQVGVRLSNNESLIQKHKK